MRYILDKLVEMHSYSAVRYTFATCTCKMAQRIPSFGKTPNAKLKVYVRRNPTQEERAPGTEIESVGASAEAARRKIMAQHDSGRTFAHTES